MRETCLMRWGTRCRNNCPPSPVPHPQGLIQVEGRDEIKDFNLLARKLLGLKRIVKPAKKIYRRCDCFSSHLPDSLISPKKRFPMGSYGQKGEKYLVL